MRDSAANKIKTLIVSAIKRFWRDYFLELVTAIISVLLTVGMYLIFVKQTLAKEFIPVANVGFLFVVAQIYGRLKDRRDAKRKRAQELFLEWHSKDIRESRIYLSRWRLVHKEIIGNLPSLGEIEIAAADLYKAKYNNPAASGKKKLFQELDDPELREIHAFRIYQFFERWKLLIKNNDIDSRSADEYMGSYKDWWLDNFIVIWISKESDEYIQLALSEILVYLRPENFIEKLSLFKDKS